MAEIFTFDFEYITEPSTVQLFDNTHQVGFLNLSESPGRAYINSLELPFIPDPERFKQASYILWMPINAGEKDKTVYKVSFALDNTAPKLLVIRKSLRKN